MAENRIKELEGKLAEKDQTIKNLRVELAALTVEINESQGKFEEQLSRIAAEQEKVSTEREAKIKELEDKIQKQKFNIDELQALLEGREGFKELQDKVKLLESLNDKKAKEIDKLKADKEKVQQELEKYTAKAKGMSIKDYQKELEKREARIDELNLKIADLEGLQTELKREQSDIEQAFGTQEDRIKQLQTVIDEKDQEIEKMSSGLDAQKIKAYDEFVLQLQTELNAVKDQLADSERLRSEQSTSIQRFEALLGQVTAQIEQQEAAAAAAVTTAQQKQPAYQQPSPAQPVYQQPMATQPPQYQPAQPQIQVPPTPPPRDVQFPHNIESQVIELLDKIGQIARTRITAQQLGLQMEQIRGKIVEIYQWHPALFELAAFARRLKGFPEGTGIDAGTLASLLEQVESWKARIFG